MEFVGTTVDELIAHTKVCGAEVSVSDAAEEFLQALQPIGRPFDIPWTFAETLDVFAGQLPTHLRTVLTEPGSGPSENHLEACAVALALEAGVTLQPLTGADMRRLQHTASHALESSSWGRRSPYPWDTVAAARLDEYDFFALRANT